MAGSLPEPVLLSTFLGMDEITILGQEVVFKHVFYSWIAMAVLFRLCALPARQVETGAWRGAEFFEAVIETTEKFIMSSMGEAGKHYVPLLCGMLIYIFAMNILGPHTWLRCANRQSQHHCLHGTFVFVYYNWVGLCRWKTHYINQFLGPNKWLILLMFPTGNRIAPIAAGFSFSPSFSAISAARKSLSSCFSSWLRFWEPYRFTGSFCWARACRPLCSSC